MLQGFGWVAVTPMTFDGSYGSLHTFEKGVLEISASAGLRVTYREPLLPFEASNTTKTDWRAKRRKNRHTSRNTAAE